MYFSISWTVLLTLVSLSIFMQIWKKEEEEDFWHPEKCTNVFFLGSFPTSFSPPPHPLKRTYIFVLSLVAKRLETYKELDSDNEDWAKYLNLFAQRGGETATLTQASTAPLRRCQSARAHFQGHARKKTLGRSGGSPFQVAFSSALVSNTFSFFPL